MAERELEPSRELSRGKSLAFALIAVVSTILLGALAAEGLFHLLGPGVTVRPGGPRPPINDARLLIRCIGDSYTFGVGAPSGALSYPAQLHELLREKHPDKKTCVWNEGVPAINSSEMLKVMQDGLLTGPDLPTVYVVLLAHNNNWNMHLSSLLKQGGGPISESRWLKILGSLEGARMGKLATITTLRGKALFDGIIEQGNLLTDEAARVLDPGDSVQREFMKQWMQLDMQKMAELAKSNNSAVLFATYHRNWDQKIYLEVAPLSGEPYCLPPKGGLDWESHGWLSENGWHPNEKGYAAFAEHIADCLESKGLLN
jgi:lysophospholipase L1-like esterase